MSCANKESDAGFSRWTKRRRGLKNASLMMEEMSKTADTLEDENYMSSHRVGTSLNNERYQSVPQGCEQEDSVPEASTSYHVADESLENTSLANQQQTKCGPLENMSVDHQLENESNDSTVGSCEEVSDAEEKNNKEMDASIYLPILCMIYYLRDHLTKTALDHHLKILVAATKTSIKALTSPHNLFSKYRHLKSSIEKIYVCRLKECQAELVLDDKSVPLEKQPCGHKYVKNRSSDCYILQLPIADQIVHYIKTYHLTKDDVTSTTSDPNFRSDVHSGDNYQKLKGSGCIDENTITLQINTDGAQTFKSSKFSIWPLMGIINEASYKIRRSCIILLALWFGNKKPARETLLTRAVKELNILQTIGVTVNSIIYKVRILIISTDTVARPLVRNSTQYNGEFGCDFCLHPGERVPKGKGSARVYPQPTSKPSFQPRSMEQHNRDKKLAQQLKIAIHGIAGSNPFEDLVGFNHVEAYVPEYMHSCCLGVFKMFIKLWTDKKYKNEKWYIGHLLNVINARLAQAKPPYDISRTVDSLSDLTNWKASMYRTFTLYYFHLLEGILPSPYFEHYSSLVYGMFLLLQERVSVVDVCKVESLFEQFVVDAERLYGIGHIGINMHFLTHLPSCVLKWGCLWATSAYIPEWFNGFLLSMCKGTQSITEQMSNSYLLNLAVREEAIGLLKSEELPPNIEFLLKDLLHLSDDSFRKLGKGKVVNSGQVKLMGGSYCRKLTSSEELAIRNKLQNRRQLDELTNVDFEQVQFFNRFQLNSIGSIFTTTSYGKSPKRLNYCALLQDGNFIAIESIVFFSSMSLAFIIGRIYGSISKQHFLPVPIEGIDFTPIHGLTTRLFGKSPVQYAFDPCEIKKKCVLSLNNELTGTYIATSLANHLETD